MEHDRMETCPGLNIKHGFLHSINHSLVLSSDHMLQQQQIKQEKINIKDRVDKTRQKKPKRPTVELYSIPARRKGGDPYGPQKAVLERRGSCSASSCVKDAGIKLGKDLKMNGTCIRNGGMCDPTDVTKGRCSCTSESSDFLESRLYEVQEFEVKQAQGYGSSCEENRSLETGTRSDTQPWLKEQKIRSLPAPDFKSGNTFGSFAACPSSMFEFSGHVTCTSPLRGSTTVHENPEKNCADDPGSVAEHTLRKLLRKKPKEGHALYIKTLNPGVQAESPTLLSQAVSNLVVEALQDTTQVSSTHLHRIAEVLVANSSISELFSYRMRYVVMFIIQKEKELTKSGTEQRFVNALLEACQNEKGKNKNVSVTTGLPFLNFVTVMYCCNVFHESARLLCAELIYSHIHSFIKVSSDALQAEQIFYLLKKVGPLLEIDIPTQMYQLYVTVREKFLSSKTCETVKDVLLDIIEARAAGWVTV